MFIPYLVRGITSNLGLFETRLNYETRVSHTSASSANPSAGSARWEPSPQPLPGQVLAGLLLTVCQYLAVLRWSIATLPRQQHQRPCRAAPATASPGVLEDLQNWGVGGKTDKFRYQLTEGTRWWCGMLASALLQPWLLPGDSPGSC